ncbi:DNA polymerase III subunit gamma/tau [Campylobacter suis]|uniref:DNA polymerase III subunit gamma/tau n=1 Tax=Campylobacter suis TaxID=2790657 RepID=A0ABM8Q114_9BACT|nr:DNA polymerase III subunit gamma/tau [Campylobacter suis]CAD7286462.1 hypothetical protein LMG8286_00295 [Campylobacter suis]
MQALALKYRPKNFDELIGQEAVSKSLSHALNEGRISHAYLFSGLRGSGKTSSARIFSKALVCEHGPSSRPCEICPHCQMANESRHMDIIEMDAASHRKIDDIRELIEQTKYAPASARYKIFIIDEVHMLTKEAFNALLKTLEEPPSYVKFILATTDPLKLPATVLSRTQHFRFKQISRLNIIKHLQFILSKEGISYENEALEILARSGSGSLRDTLTLLDQAIIFSEQKLTQSSVASMLGLLDPSRIEQILDTILAKDKETLRVLISEFESYEPEMIIDELIANLKEKFLAGDSKFSLLVYERFLRILAQAKSMLTTTSDNGFVLCVMFFMMLEALNLQSIDDAIAISQTTQISQTPKPQQNIDSQPVKQMAQAQPILKQAPQKSQYEVFTSRLYDRDYDLGECFRRSVEFVSFESDILTLATPQDGDDRQMLVDKFKIINQICKEIFGANTKIDAQKKQIQKPKSSLDEMMSKELENIKETSLQQTPDTQPVIQKEPKEKPSLLSINSNKSETEREAIRQNSILQEAQNLFGTPRIE